MIVPDLLPRGHRPWCRGVLAAFMGGAMHEEGFAHGRYGGAG
jgi:hypothetical protein